MRQTQTLGGESISGAQCAQTQAFSVNFTTPRVTFTTAYVPAGKGESGTWTYAYSIPGAGETHSASGNYTVHTNLSTKTLHLTMTGTDNVAFKGFAGPFQINYGFDLVAAPGSACLGARP